MNITITCAEMKSVKRQKKLKRKWVPRQAHRQSDVVNQCVGDIQRLQGENDALIEVKEEIENKANECGVDLLDIPDVSHALAAMGGGASSPNGGHCSGSLKGGSTGPNNNLSDAIDIALGAPVDFRLSFFERPNLSFWHNVGSVVLGTTVFGIARRMGRALGESISAGVGYAIGSMAGTWLARKFFLLDNMTEHVSHDIPQITTQMVIRGINAGVRIDPLKWGCNGAKLMGTLRTQSQEQRPPRHQASRCQKFVELQMWRVWHGMHYWDILVNGDLFAELISQNHSKDERTALANIAIRTCQPADYNLSAAVQYRVNPDTAFLSKMYLRLNAMKRTL